MAIIDYKYKGFTAKETRAINKANDYADNDSTEIWENRDERAIKLVETENGYKYIMLSDGYVALLVNIDTLEVIDDEIYMDEILNS